MWPAAPLGPPRNDDRQLAVIEPCARLADLERAGQADRSGKSTELAFDQMVGAARIAGSFRPGDQHDTVAKQHPQRIGVNTGDVEKDLDAGTRFEHIEDGMTLA